MNTNLINKGLAGHILIMVLSAVLVGGLSSRAAAADVSPVPDNMSTPVGDPQLKKTLEERLGFKIDSITSVPYAGLYEVTAGSEIVYSDAKGDFVFVGNVIDMRSHVNLTKGRLAELQEQLLPAVKVSDLPLNSAIKIVKGNGKRTLIAFEDPNCVFCKRMEKALTEVTDVTEYVFLYPILGDDSIAKAKAIWCSADRAKTWTDWMQKGVEIAASAQCANPIDDNVALGTKLKIDGTPTSFFKDGKRVTGAMDTDALSKNLASH
jgi:thiol:disulfide interchange protein DsbC